MMSSKLLLFSLAFILMGCQAESTSETPPPQWLQLEGAADQPHIVLISGDEEYRSEEALPQLARILNTHHGYNCTVLFAQNPEKPGLIDPNYTHHIPGLEHLADADLMVIFTRFRALPDEQMQHIDAYLKAGKPVIGLRTATHAFQFSESDTTAYAHYSNSYNEADAWEGGFGRLVLGERWVAHHGHHKHESTRGIVAPSAAAHPIWSGIADGAIWGPTDVYRVRLPLPGDSQPLVLGQVVERAGAYDEADSMYGMRSTDTVLAGPKEAAYDPNNPLMPVAWIKSYQLPGGETGKVFATTMGAATDLLSEGTRRMLVNAVYWSLGQEVPQAAQVDIVGAYVPSPFAFHDDQHWVTKDLRIAEIISN